MKNQVKQKTVLLGMSGGVDSSVAALLLKKQGYKVMGAFMKNFSDTKNPLTGECTWREERRMAQSIAIKLNIPLMTIDSEKKYKKEIIEPMFSEYEKGRTPNPDIDCNKKIKFPLLWKSAKKLKADYIATGHYARIKKTKKGYALLAGIDKSKDQSYFVYELSENDLKHILFPIGDLTKKEVREIAKNHNFPNYNKKSTSGICFVGKVNMNSFLKRKIKEKKGSLLDAEGNIIGSHPGMMYYTIGQRICPHIGINFSKNWKNENKKWYVAEKRKNNLIVVPEFHPLLKKKKVLLKSLHLVNQKEKIPGKLKARIRHLGILHSGKLKKENNKFIFIFNKPIKAIAESQHIVLYKKDKVIGGGEMRFAY